MRRLKKSLLLAAAIISAGCLAAGCGQTGGGGAISSASPSKTISVPSITAPSRSQTAGPTAQPPVTHSAVAPAPTTQPPVTHSAVAPALTAQPSSTPTPSSGSSSSLLWLWIVLGAVVLIGVIVLIARSRGRRSAAAADWRSRVTDVYAQGSALYDAMSVAEGPGALAAESSGARWADIQHRADDLTQKLYALREAAPDEESRAPVAEVLASLQAVRSAMDAERAPGGAGTQQAETVRWRLSALEASLRVLRESDQRLP